MTAIFVWIILFDRTLPHSGSPIVLENYVYQTRERCETEIVRVHQLALRFKLSDQTYYCQPLTVQK